MKNYYIDFTVLKNFLNACSPHLGEIIKGMVENITYGSSDRFQNTVGRSFIQNTLIKNGILKENEKDNKDNIEQLNS